MAAGGFHTGGSLVEWDDMGSLKMACNGLRQSSG